MSEKIKNVVSKKSFDTEYSTQWRREYEYLLSQGIKAAFVRMDKETGIRTYKYTKTPELFKKLYGFYAMVEAEKGLKEAEAFLAEKGEKCEGELPEEFKTFKAVIIE